ncbi:MAG TPA: G5 domain-containing protein, partial [Anaerolineaceae bacterium]
MLVVLVLTGCSAAQATTEMVAVTISVDGKQIVQQVPVGTTVQNALQKANITLNNLDRVEPASYTILGPKDVVKVTRVREVFSVKETIVPFERQTIHNESLPEGKTLLVQQGVNGVEQVTYRQVLENDQEISNGVFKTEIITDPQPEVMMVGVQKPFTPVPIPGRLVYLAGGNAWLMETTTGNRRPLVTTGDLDGRVFEVSPKGDWLLYSRADKSADTTSGTDASQAKKINSLWAVDVSEEGSKPINLKVANVIHFAAWVPGKGLTITYSTVEPRSTSPGWQANNDLQMLTFAASGAIIKQETILETNMGGLYGWWGTSYEWSPDGALLAYIRPDEIGLVDLEKKGQVPLLTLTPYQTGSNWAWVPGLAWSPDHYVLYTVTHAPKAGLESGEASPLFDLTGLALGRQPFNASSPPIPVVAQAGMFAYPAVSPANKDGGFKVAYLKAI